MMKLTPKNLPISANASLSAVHFSNAGLCFLDRKKMEFEKNDHYLNALPVVMFWQKMFRTFDKQNRKAHV